MKFSSFTLLFLSTGAFADCPDWAQPDQNCPTPAPFEEVWIAFYWEGTSAPHLSTILVTAGPKIVPSIVEAISDRQMYARRIAISALGLLKQREALPVLVEMLNDESEEGYFRSDALEAIYLIDAGAGKMAASELLSAPESLDNILIKTAMDVLEYPGGILQEDERY
jgi:HEAT repeat protein